MRIDRQGGGSRCDDAQTADRLDDQMLSLGIVVELDNCRHAGRSRAIQMMTALNSQARSLANRLAHPIALNVVFDPHHISNTDVADMLAEAGLDPSPHMETDLIPAPGADYYEQKNIGARCCDSEIIILVDSDILPEEGWLAALTQSFDDPTVEFVFGETRIVTNSPYEKSYALLLEAFPYRSAASATLTRQSFLLANSLAFRAKTLGPAIFPKSTALRGQCGLASNAIQAAGHDIFMQHAAKAHHVAPNGVGHFFATAFGAGHDEVILARTKYPKTVRGTLQTSPAGSVARFVRSCFGAWSRCFTKRAEVGLRPWYIPTALLLATTYYLVRLFGELMTFFSPRLVRSLGDH